MSKGGQGKQANWCPLSECSGPPGEGGQHRNVPAEGNNIQPPNPVYPKGQILLLHQVLLSWLQPCRTWSVLGRVAKAWDPVRAASVSRVLKALTFKKRFSFLQKRKVKHLSLKDWISSELDSKLLFANALTLPHIGVDLKLRQFSMFKQKNANWRNWKLFCVLSCDIFWPVFFMRAW